MLANLVRAIVSAVVAVGIGVLLYLDERVLGFVITSLTVGLLVFGLIGLLAGAAFAVRAGLRLFIEPPEVMPAVPADRRQAEQRRAEHLRTEAATSPS
ncbi:MAG: hypothetical protein HXX10_21355 [Rhodoplanes sp.]|uniref:hypothetical protein n=1 Tax=Rhodoplanes sp. TaxID=1968906 RepID=UPI00181DE981|nr:hypothetical protein [Rhodoplanes sp.]NVO16583.1 hypothetical protein [Rhodoplanes sp.]